MNRFIGINRSFLTLICFGFALYLEPKGQMLLQFNSAKLQSDASQIANITFDGSNRTELDFRNFTCTCNSPQQFARIVQLRTCPLHESNLTCAANALYINSTVMAGNTIKSLLSNWSGGVQLECWALNPYKFTAFSGVQQSTWRISLIAEDTTTSIFIHCSDVV